MALTEKQRQAIYERDNHECQFPACPLRANGNSAKVACTPKKLNAHHVLPQRYSELFGINPDFAENAITICEGVHIRSEQGIHPDMARALREYRTNPDAVKQVFEQREHILEERQPYWNTEWDRPMSAIAIKRTQEAKKEGWEFPEKKNKNGNGNGHKHEEETSTSVVLYQAPPNGNGHKEQSFEEMKAESLKMDEIRLAELRQELDTMAAAD